MFTPILIYMQAFTFYASEDKLVNRGNQAGVKIGVESINREACRIAKEVAAEGPWCWAGSPSAPPTSPASPSRQSRQSSPSRSRCSWRRVWTFCSAR